MYTYRNGIPYLAGKPVSLPKPEPGYHFVSSRRYPREPEISAGTIPQSARFRGTATIDGTRCYCWRFTEDGKARYAFQTAFGW
jgi:hypothetical protein